MDRSERRRRRERAFNKALRLMDLFGLKGADRLRVAYRYFKNRKPCACPACKNNGLSKTVKRQKREAEYNRLALRDAE